MTLRSLSKNVEILPESTEDSLVIRLSDMYSERLKRRTQGCSGLAAADLEEMILDIAGEVQCPFCDKVSPCESRFCICCGKAIDPLAQEYERKLALRMQKMEEKETGREADGESGKEAVKEAER